MVEEQAVHLDAAREDRVRGRVGAHDTFEGVPGAGVVLQRHELVEVAVGDAVRRGGSAEFGQPRLPQVHAAFFLSMDKK